MVVIIPLLSRLGRVKCYCGSFISGGVCCFIVALITIFAGENEMVMVTVGIAMLGKLDHILLNASFEAIAKEQILNEMAIVTKKCFKI